MAYQYDSNLLPDSTGRDLGSPTQRWDLYPQTIDTPTTLAGVRYADQFTGTDIGAKVNAAYANLPSTGGRIRIVPGAYSFTTPISLATASKGAIIEGDGGNSVALTFSSLTTGTAYTSNCAATHVYGHGLRDLKLIGSTGTNKALVLGGSVGSEGFKASNLHIEGFATGIEFANNFWAGSFDHLFVTSSGKALYAPSGLTNSGESINFTDCFFVGEGGFVTDCVKIDHTMSNLSFVGGAFDGAQYSQSQGVVHHTNIHYENPNVQTNSPFVKVTGGTLVIVNGDFLQSVSGAGTVPTSFIDVSAGTVILIGCSFWNSSATAMAQAIKVSGTGNVYEYGTKIRNANITTLYTNTGSGLVGTLNNIDSINNINGQLNVKGNVIQLDDFQRLQWGGANDFISGNAASKQIFLYTDGKRRFYVDTSGSHFRNSADNADVMTVDLTGVASLKRIKASSGTALVAGDFALSGGWGSTAAVSAITGTDQAFQFTVTPSGAGIGANPTITLTFKDGTWTSSPIAVVQRAGGSDATPSSIGLVATATTLTIAPVYTPVSGNTTIFSVIVMGR
jgi:hypothetical protein